MTTDNNWTFETDWDFFTGWVERELKHVHVSSSKGASNAPFVIENGFRVGLFNLQNVNFTDIQNNRKMFCFITRMILPPRNALHLAVVFSQDKISQLETIRDKIINSGVTAKQIRVYLSEGGRVYLRQVGGEFASDPLKISPSDTTFEHSITPDRVLFANVQKVGRLDPTELAYIDYWGRLLTPVPLERLNNSRTNGGIIAPLDSIGIDEIAMRINNLGGVFTDELVHRFHVALNHLNHKHFAILTGISGTGKTLLARAYAFAALNKTDLSIRSNNFHLIPVRPDWTEPAHIIGFLDAISGTFRRTRFVDALLYASNNRDEPVFVVLDEMNLAQPEHYFADIMSAMETGEDLILHEGDEAEAGVPRRISWPRNLYIIGTVNVDETTRPFSPKLLDRANVIDMSEVDLQNFILRKPEVNSAFTDEAKRLLLDLHGKFSPHALHFGYRTVDEMALYLEYARRKGVLNDIALDIQVEQKILTKLRGGRAQAKMLADVRVLLSGYPRSKAVIERMISDLEEYDSFQYWS